MKSTGLLPNSLKTRVTLATLAIFVVSLWLLSYYVSQMLRQDIEQVLGEQQLSSVTLLAAQVNGELQMRQNALDLVAASSGDALRAGALAIQTLLEQRQVLQLLFNAGVVAYDAAGTPIAQVPPTTRRVGDNDGDRDAVADALRTGKSTIGMPVMGRELKRPVFGMATPIRDANGEVIGALAGVVDLGLPNFIDHITDNRYGKSGGYLLIAPQLRTIITASDKSRIMEVLPQRGINPAVDRFIDGYQGSAILTTARGEEILVSEKRIPVTGWTLSASLSTAEAFAPIRDLQQRMRLATLLLTLLAGSAIAYLLRRQLAPLHDTARLLSSLSDTRRPLPIVRNDEIGQLVGAFNGLLTTLGARETALTQSETRYRTLFRDFVENSPYGLWLTDREHRVSYVNRAMAGVPGVAGELRIGTRVGDLAQDDAPCLATHYFSAADSGRTSAYECRVASASGEERWIGGWLTPLLENGTFCGMLCSVEDISARKQTEERVSELYRNFVSFLDSTRDFIYFKDRDSRFRFCSQTLADITGHASWRDMIGKHDLEVFPPDTAKIYHEEEFPIFNEGKSVLDRIDPYYDAAGNPGWVCTNKWPLFDEQGQVVGLFGISTDITARRKSEDELAQYRHHLEELVTSRTAELALARDAAEAASRAKTAFLANMSHEIRTPLNAIMGMTNIVQRSGVTPTQAGRLAQIDHAARHLLAIINDVLDISKVEAGKLVLENVALHVPTLLDKVCAILAERAQRKGLALRVECAALPQTLHGDPTRLQQALLNYASNAIKFSAAGDVIVRAFAEHDSPDAVVVRFEVEDKGIGIAAATLPRLFSAFEQADNSTTREYGGTGLGLAITKRLAELMGGTVGVQSQPGAGSTFWFTARLTKHPLHADPAPAVAPPSADAERLLRENFHASRVLLVDDEPVNLAVAQFLLEDAGLVVDTASDGQQAIDRAASAPYALILMDMQMPIVDGLEATRQIRRLPGHRRTPILATTANAYEGDRQRCFDAGMNGFLVKPLAPAVLYSVLLKWLRQARERPE